MRAAREARLSNQNAKRRRMREDLEQRERKSKAETDAEAALRARLKAELDRLRKDLKSKDTPPPGRSMNAVASVSKSGASVESTECMVKLSWGEGCTLLEKEINALFAALGTIKMVVMKKLKKKRKGGSALLEMGSREEAEGIVRHVQVNDGFGLDSFTAGLISIDEGKATLEKKIPWTPPHNSNQTPKTTVVQTPNLQSLEDMILSKMKRKSQGQAPCS